MASGVAGATLGLVAASIGSPLDAVLAGACALVGAGWSLVLLGWLQAAEAAARRGRQSAPGRAGGIAPMRGCLGDRPDPVPTRLASTPRRAQQVTAAVGQQELPAVVTARLAVARRHLWPVTIVHLAAMPPPGFSEDPSAVQAGLGAALRSTLRESDAICQLAASRYALVLEDTDERGGVWAVERFQELLADAGVLVAAGIASYPVHGLEPGEVLRRSADALRAALRRPHQPGGRIVEVAPVEASEQG